MANTASKTRPKHLQLTAIRLPLPGIVSILHRVSGASLFLCLPLLLWLFATSRLWMTPLFPMAAVMVACPFAAMANVVLHPDRGMLTVPDAPEGAAMLNRKLCAP